jgi:hypothetical protein
LVASYASKQFQALWNGIQKSVTGEKVEGDEHQDDLATVKVADDASELVTGLPVPAAHREQAGELVHYLTGAGLGAAYALAAGRAPRVTAGFGTAYGMAANLLLNEALLPALSLSASPARTPAVKHLYAATTHLVFRPGAGRITPAPRERCPSGSDLSWPSTCKAMLPRCRFGRDRCAEHPTVLPLPSALS